MAKTHSRFYNRNDEIKVFISLFYGTGCSIATAPFSYKVDFTPPIF